MNVGLRPAVDLTLLSFLFLPQIVNLTVTNDVPLKYQTTAWERFRKMEASFHPRSELNLILTPMLPLRPHLLCDL